MFLELVNTDVYLNNLINFGIENKHYVKVSDNIIDFAPDTEQGKKSGYNPQLAWVFGNQFINYLFTNEDPKKWDKYDTFNKSAIPLKSLGFAFDGNKVRTEIAACKNVSIEFSAGFGIGSVDTDTTMTKFQEKLEAAGINNIVAEVQAQFDAWLANYSG